MMSRSCLLWLAALLIAPHQPPSAGADPTEPEALTRAEALKRFGDSLTESDEEFFVCIAGGRPFKPAAARGRIVIGADRIAWACTSPRVVPLVTHKGIRIEGVEVDGVLDLADAKLLFPLQIRSSTFRGRIDLANAEVRSLDFDGSKVGEFCGRSMRSSFDVRLGDGFEARETVDLSNADIDGDLNLSGGSFLRPGGVAIYADYMRVGRDLLMSVNLSGSDAVMNRFVAIGMVRMTGSTVDGAVNCDGGQFRNAGRVAINAAGMTVKGNVHLSRKSNDMAFAVAGLVELSNARIGGNLYGGGGIFSGDGTPTGHALRAHVLQVDGEIEFNSGFLARGKVDLTGARVGGSLDCRGAGFRQHEPAEPGSNGTDKVALDIGSATVGHDVLLGCRFRSSGIVNLERSAIGGNLDCSGGQFHHPYGHAIEAGGMAVKGSVFLGMWRKEGRKPEPFLATGSVCMADSRIGGDLDCTGGRSSYGQGRKPGSEDPAGLALDVSGTIVEGNALLDRGFEPRGEVKLFNAKIGRQLRIPDVAKGSRPRMTLDLTAAKAGGVNHPEDGWPPALVDGFSYDSVIANKMDVGKWIDWLKNRKAYAGGPHEHLASVLQKSGHADEARRVLIDKEEWKGQQMDPDPSEGWAVYLVLAGRWFWYRLVGPIIRFGYGPEHSLLWGAAFVLVGWLVFSWAFRKDVFVPKDANPALPDRPFVPLLYSIDLFTPVISFYEREGWVLDLEPRAGRNVWALRLFRLYWMSHIVLGWAITSLLVAGLLGLVHHD